MSRLPNPGADENVWGNVLNDFLGIEHNPDGTHKSIVNPDATTVGKGKIRLAGDLDGTANAPTVPGLANKESLIGTGTTAQYWRGDKTWQNFTATKSLTIQAPGATENVGLFHTDKAVTLTQVHAVLRGSSTPTTTFNIAFGGNRSVSSTTVFASDVTADSTTNGNSFTSFGTSSVAQDDMLWLTTSATTGTVDELTVTIHYTVTGT